MKNYTKEFLKARERVEKAEKKLEEERQKLQDLCPHVNLDGTTTFPKSLSFADCTLCGKSSYYV